jgi:uncharacterized repeat protein (TIGR01451 family)
MFRKLVSNLPFQPALLGQVSFYLHRMRQEESLRRIGFALMAVVVVLQLFAMFSPAKPSLATSSADIIYGANSRDDVLTAYRNNRDQIGHNDIKAIYNYYGIGADQIANAKLVHISDGDGHDYINTSRSTTRWQDTFVKIPGASDGGIYEFSLSYWRQGQYPNGYPALTGMSTYGFRFWILLKGCGNIVYEKGAKKPNLDIVKKRTSGATVAPGDASTYSIEFRNAGLANANGVTISDRLAPEFSYVAYTSNVDLTFAHSGQQLTWKIKNTGSTLAPSTRWYWITVKVKAKDISANSQKVCNASSIDASNAGAASSSGTDTTHCVTINKPLCPGTGLPVPPGGVSKCTVTCPDGSTVGYDKTCPVPQLSCQSLQVAAEPAWNSRKYETTIVMQKGAVAKQIDYYVNNTKVGSQPMASGSTSQFFSYTFPKEGDYKVRADLIATTGTVQPGGNCAVTETITKPTQPTPRISTDKGVTNLTQKIADANGTTAHAGDVLRYTLTIANTGDAPATDFALSGEYGENIADIMEYADLTDKGDATLNETTKVLTWAPVTIPAGGQVQKTFTVTIKNPIPATPTSVSNPLSFDYVMHNKYGRDVSINLDKPANKIIEQTATSLPETGPGTGMFVTAIVVMVVGYFFYRSRLLTKELELVHHEYSAGGL